MQRWLARRLAALGLLAILAFCVPMSVFAEITGGCTATGTSTNGEDVDITTEAVWHLDSDDSAGGSGTAPAPMRSATIGAYALGLQIPIASGTGTGDTNGSVDPISLETFAVLGKVFLVAGSASGDGQCSGQILIVLDDVDALFTLLGGGGLVLAIIGLAAILASTKSSGCVAKALAAIFGGLGGAGLALSLEQFQVINPTTPIGLAMVIIGALLGFVLAGRFSIGGETPPGPRSQTVPVTPTPPPARVPPASSPPTTTDDVKQMVDDMAPSVFDPPTEEYPAGGRGGCGPG